MVRHDDTMGGGTTDFSFTQPNVMLRLVIRFSE